MSAVAKFDEIRRGLVNFKNSSQDKEIRDLLWQYEKSCEDIIHTVKKVEKMEKKFMDAVQSKEDLKKSLIYTRRLLKNEVQTRREAERSQAEMRKVYMNLVDMLRNTANLNDEAKREFADYIKYLPRHSPINMNIEDKFNNYVDSYPDRQLISQKLFTRQSEFISRTEETINDHESSEESQNEKSDSSIKDTVNKSVFNIPIKKSCFGLNTSGAIYSTENSTSNIETVAERALTTIEVPTDDVTIPMIDQCTSMRHNATSSDRSRFLMWRQHNFLPKPFTVATSCLHCRKKIRFGSVGLRCRNCPLCCHIDCRNSLDVSCVPYVKNNTAKKSISDYAPSIPPMIPGPIVYCINEIEKRGVNEKGIYNIEGDERHVKNLKAKFLRGKGIPYLGDIDIHVLTSCVKVILRSFCEPIIPHSAYVELAATGKISSKQDSRREFNKIINKLPQANRDTLSFLMIHFQHVAETPFAEMPIDKLIYILAPLILGDLSLLPSDQDKRSADPYTRFAVMKRLLEKSKSTWVRHLNVDIDA